MAVKLGNEGGASSKVNRSVGLGLHWKKGRKIHSSKYYWDGNVKMILCSKMYYDGDWF